MQISEKEVQIRQVRLLKRSVEQRGVMQPI